MSGSAVGISHSFELQKIANHQIIQLITEIPDLFTNSYEQEYKLIQELADSLEDYTDHATYQTVVTHLRESKSLILRDVSSTFNKALKTSHDIETIGAEKALNFHNDNLSIVTDKELVYQLQLESGFTDSRNNFDKTMIQSGWKFCRVAKEHEINEKLDLVRPGALALILQSAIDTHIEDKQVARIAYRFIGGNFFHLLSQHYQVLAPALTELAEALTESNKPRNNSHEKEEHTFPANDLPRVEVSEVDSLEEIEKAFGTNIDVTGLLRNWDVPAQLKLGSIGEFQGFSDINLDQLSPDTQIKTATITDVVQLLQTLSDKARLDTDQGLDIQDVRSALKTSLSQLSDEGILTVIDKVSENILNLVTHLFENINDQGLLIDDVVSQISRIQAPVMQVALTDSKLFQSNEHPVRQYLNSLGELGIKISDSSEEGYLELRDSISSLLKGFDGKLDSFEKCNHDLCEYIENSIYDVKHRDGNFEATDYQSALKFAPIRDFLDSQSSMVKNELNFHKLTKYVWGAILAKIIRRHGTGSEAWNHATDIYSSALWSTQVSGNNQGKREILRRLPKIVQGVRSLFDEYGLEIRIRDAILDQMIRIHLQIMRGKNGAEIAEDNTISLELFRCFKGRILSETHSEHNAEFDSMEFNESENVVDPLTSVFTRFDAISPFEMEQKSTPQQTIDWGEISEADHKMIDEIRNNTKQQELPSKEKLQSIFESLNQMPLDTIISFTKYEGTRRYRLADKSVTLGKFTFKTFEGEHTLVKTKGELAIDISRKIARIVSDKNLFDDALENVVTQIQSSRH